MEDKQPIMDNSKKSSIGELLTPLQAAEYLQVTAEQVRGLIRKGQLAACNVGTGNKRPFYRIKQQALKNFQEQRYLPVSAAKQKKFKRLAPVQDYFPDLD